MTGRSDRVKPARRVRWPWGDRAIREEDLEGDQSVQVATGIEPETGEVVVLVRLGRLVASMEPEAARTLSDSLAAEAAIASMHAAAMKAGGE